MSPAQGSITVAFVVIGVLIAAKHTSWISTAVNWLKAPVSTQARVTSG